MSNSSSKPTTISDSPSFSNPNPNSTPVETKQEQESDSQPLDLDIDIENPSKKHKPLSSFTSPQPQPKKPKKKTNNVWTKSTSRKKPKKKPTNGSGPHPLPNGGPHTPILPIPSSNGSDPIHITPITRFPDKSDDSPDLPTLLSRYYKAEKVELSDDRLTAGSTKGYRMVRATRGVGEGAWYFEIKLLNMGKTGHTRLGWVTEKGDLQAPVGYDGWSYGYRDLDGSKVHKALREKYGEGGYGEGDVIGFYISLPDGGKYALKMPHLVLYKGQSYMYPADEKDDSPKIVPGSEISFYKNGECQGVAFTDLTGGRYYPAASMYTLPGEPNCEVRFNFGPNFEFFPGDFGGRPTPRPMSEVPYHGYEVKNEGPTKMRASP